MSLYEEKVGEILKESKIPYEREKKFQDFRNGLCRFDFWLPSFSTLIEVQGEQHFIFNKKFFKRREDFLKARERDRRKIAYAQAHEIPLYIIPFWELPKLHEVDDILNERFRATTKFFNDDLWREYQKNRAT